MNRLVHLVDKIRRKGRRRLPDGQRRRQREESQLWMSAADVPELMFEDGNDLPVAQSAQQAVAEEHIS